MVCPYSLSRPGGVQGQVVGLARALRQRGHHVTVLAPDDRHPVGWTDGVYVVGRTVGLRSNGSVAPVSVSPSAARRAASLVAGGQFDVVHLHEPLAPVVGYGCLWQHQVPVVATFHRSGGSGWYRALRPMAQWARRRIDVPCAVSEAARSTATEALGGDYEVLFNGVEIDRYAAAQPTPTAGVPTVLFLGRHEERKGLGVLLAAFEKVAGPYRLWIAGDGPQTESLRSRYPASDRIVWLGLLSEEEVAARLAGADVLCAPALGGESFGMVIVEGFAAGCAVIASDIDGYRAAAGGHAALVPPGDPVALASALDAALEDVASGSGRSSALAKEAAAGHAGGWSMERLAAIYDERYQRAVAARRRS
jgi:phosphatidylinositol alpha-mannosyltransferase